MTPHPGFITAAAAIAVLAAVATYTRWAYRSWRRGTGITRTTEGEPRV